MVITSFIWIITPRGIKSFYGAVKKAWSLSSISPSARDHSFKSRPNSWTLLSLLHVHEYRRCHRLQTLFLLFTFVTSETTLNKYDYKQENYLVIKMYKLLTYNPGQNSWDTNVKARQIQASPPPPPGAVLTLCIQALIQHNQHCLGERGTAEIARHNNIPKLLQEVKYELIWQSESLCLFSPSVPRRFDQGCRFVYTDMFTLHIKTYFTYVIIHCTNCLSPHWLKAYSWFWK